MATDAVPVDGALSTVMTTEAPDEFLSGSSSAACWSARANRRTNAPASPPAAIVMATVAISLTPLKGLEMEHGQRFGLLTVVGFSDEKRGGEQVVRLRCDCGEDATSVGSTLRAGKKLSCGCRRRRSRPDLRAKFPQLWDAEWLASRYVADGWATARIADELGCSQPAVHKALTRAGIRTRPPGAHFTVHGHARVDKNTPTYRSWINMKNRCCCPNSTNYRHYGGRGISVCDRWRDSYENFLADMGERPEGKSIDRIDVAGNYEPSNCRWATQSEQLRNRRPRQKAA